MLGEWGLEAGDRHLGSCACYRLRHDQCNISHNSAVVLRMPSRSRDAGAIRELQFVQDQAARMIATAGKILEPSMFCSLCDLQPARVACAMDVLMRRKLRHVSRDKLFGAALAACCG